MGSSERIAQTPLDNLRLVSTVKITEFEDVVFYETMVFDRRGHELDCVRTNDDATARVNHDKKVQEWR